MVDSYFVELDFYTYVPDYFDCIDCTEGQIQENEFRLRLHFLR